MTFDTWCQKWKKKVTFDGSGVARFSCGIGSEFSELGRLDDVAVTAVDVAGVDPAWFFDVKVERKPKEKVDNLNLIDFAAVLSSCLPEFDARLSVEFKGVDVKLAEGRTVFVGLNDLADAPEHAHLVVQLLDEAVPVTSLSLDMSIPAVALGHLPDSKTRYAVIQLLAELVRVLARTKITRPNSYAGPGHYPGPHVK